MSPLRALHVHSGNIYGGIESTLVTLARRRDLLPDVHWQFALTHAGRLSAALVAAGADVAVIGAARASRPWTVWAAVSQLGLLLDRQPCDVAIVHSQWSQALFGPLLRRRGIKVAYWLHGPVGGPLWLDALARRSTPAFVIANSRFMAGSRGWLAQLPCEVVYNPIAVPQPAPAPKHSPPAILIACRMEQGKGHAVLLDALARLAHREWTCWIAGAAHTKAEHEYEAGLRAHCESLGLADRVRFLGHRDDVADLMGRATLYCQPNTSPESFGNVFVEALTAGLPVVTTNIGGAREILEDSFGILVPPHDVSALAAALERALADAGLRGRLAQAGPARARELCDPAAQLPKLAAILHRLAQ